MSFFPCHIVGMETQNTQKNTLMNGDVLTPKMVLAEGLLPGVGQTWLYKYWESLGGKTIGTKKFILRETLYASLQRSKTEEQAPDVADQSQGAGQRFREISDTHNSGNDNNQLGNSKRGQGCRERVGKVSTGNVLTDHSNQFGFGQFV